MSMIRGDKRIDFGKFVIASIKRQGGTFEILVDPDKAWEVKKAIRIFQKDREKEKNATYKVTVDDLLSFSKIPMEEIIEGFKIFEDIRRGQHVSEETLEEAFGTKEIRRITAEILLEGELQLTKEQRDKFVADKKKKLIDILTKNCINPQTSKPHPPGRIEKALDETKVSIDPFNPIEDQVRDIVKALKAVIPIKMEQVIMHISVPAEFTGKAYNLITTFASISKEDWKNNGALDLQAELPSGIQVEFLDKLNKLTRGRATTKIVETRGT